MKNNKEVRISYWAAHLTTVVSVTLVLLIIGIIALITVSAASETRRLRERLEVSVVMADTVSNARALRSVGGSGEQRGRSENMESRHRGRP